MSTTTGASAPAVEVPVINPTPAPAAAPTPEVIPAAAKTKLVETVKTNWKLYGGVLLALVLWYFYSQKKRAEFLAKKKENSPKANEPTQMADYLERGSF